MPDDVNRDDLVAEMDKLEDPAPTPKDPPDPKPDPAPEDPPPEPKPDPVEDEEEGDPKPPDPQMDERTTKSIERIQREERRAKESIAREVQAMRLSEAERADYQRLRSVDARRDPVAALEALGLTDADWEVAAKKAFIRSRRGKTGPVPAGQPGAGGNLEFETALDELRTQNQELRQMVEARYQAEHDERNVQHYLDGVAREVTDDHPLVSTMMKKNPARTRAALRHFANQIAEASGYGIPEPSEVIEALEKSRRAELEELGVAYPSKQKNPQAPEKKKSATTLSEDLSNPRTPKGQFKSRDEEIADVKRALEADKLE